MVMIGLYAKRYCCLAIDCRVIYKKTFLRARCLLLSSFAHKCLFPVWPCAFQKTEKYLQKSNQTIFIAKKIRHCNNHTEQETLYQKEYDK